MGFGFYRTCPRLLAALRYSGRHLFLAPPSAQYNHLQYRICLDRSLLWRWIRNHAILHRRFLRSQIHGRNLRLDPAGVGGGRDPNTDYGRALTSDHGNLFNIASYHRHRDGVLGRIATSGEASESRACFCRQLDWITLRRMMQSIGYVALVVREYDEAIAFFTDKLGFALVEDTPLEPGKRWVLVRPQNSQATSLLLARAADQEQATRIGNQTGGRVFLFLHTDDFWRDYRAMIAKGVKFIREPREESYGTVAVFEDLYGNKWDLLQLKHR